MESNTNSAEVTPSLDFFILPNPCMDDINLFFTVILFIQLVIIVENSEQRDVAFVYI